jgi:hypothetical protein|tara:strand:+ start:231 stop:518 length:288 start_codon:yes stop_codon:yes gene_type:complete
MNKEENIMKGYKGIMDLDLNLVPRAFWKEAIEQHEQDIKDYNMEQEKLPERLRYSNTVLKAYNLHEKDRKATVKRHQEQYEEDTKMINKYNTQKK